MHLKNNYEFHQKLVIVPNKLQCQEKISNLLESIINKDDQNLNKTYTTKKTTFQLLLNSIKLLQL